MIIDEHRFSRVCSAILEDIVGLKTDILIDICDLPARLSSNTISLIVTSYPFGAKCFDEIKKSRIPTIILSDSMDCELMQALKEFKESYCMIKPLDYDDFKSLVKQVVSGEATRGTGLTTA